jgi:hypothetical protein
MPNASPSDNPGPWRLEDLIDFDFALESATKVGNLSGHEHRELFLKYLSEENLSLDNAPEISRSAAFRYWLEGQRKKPPLANALPGNIFARAIRFLRISLFLLALFSGCVISAALLRYDGTQPTNVAGYLSILLGGQLLLLLLASGSLILRRLGILSWENGVIGPSIHFGLSQIVAWIQKKTLEHGAAETRLRLRAFMGSTGKKHSQYQSIIIGIVASLIQSFGIWFNVAAIVTTLLLVTVSDRAFGWQSTLDLSSSEVHNITSLIATPWAFFAPSGAPSLSEIEGSRIFLKDGIRTLTNDNLVSWWPFLVCALITYGFLPRLCLWLFTSFFIKSQLRSVGFNSLNCDRLWESMVTRELKTKGVNVIREENAPAALSEVIKKPSPAPKKAVKKEQSGIVIVEPDLAKRIDRAKTDSAIHGNISWTMNKWIRLPDETQSWSDFWELIEPLRNEKHFERLVIVQEAFQPPIRESIEWLQQLRATQPSTGKMMIFLVGRPQVAGRRKEVCETNQRVWEQSIDALNDANLGVSSLEISDANE